MAMDSTHGIEIRQEGDHHQRYGVDEADENQGDLGCQSLGRLLGWIQIVIAPDLVMSGSWDCTSGSDLQCFLSEGPTPFSIQRRQPQATHS